MWLIKKYYKKTAPFLFVIITYVLTLIFKQNPSLTESFYSTNLYPKIAFLLSSFSSLFPFSVDDVFYASLILTFSTSLILLVFRKLKLKIFVLRTLQTAAVIYGIFYWLWGFNYFRQDIHARLNLSKSQPDNEMFTQVFRKVIERTNQTYTPSWASVHADFQPLMEVSSHNLKDILALPYPNGIRRVKDITFSNFFAKATILGYYGPFFNEAHINKYLSVWDKPVVTAHEMSHQFGISSEAEANFHAWMISVNANDRFANYSGWLYALMFFAHQANDLENRKELISTIRPEIIEDIRTRSKYWQSMRNTTIDNAASKVNDAYLKSNNVKKGIDDYNYMVQLIIDFYLSDKKNIIF